MRRTRFLPAILLFLGIAALAGCREPGAAPPTAGMPAAVACDDAPRPRAASPDDVVRRKLRERVAAAFDKMAFADVIAWFRTAAGLSIYVDWGAIESAMPDAKKRVIDMHLADVSRARVLEYVLLDAGGDTVELTYIIEGGIIRITTAARIGRRPSVPLVYDVSDLLYTPPDFPPAPGVRPPDRLRAGRPDFRAPRTAAARAARIVEAIKSKRGGAREWEGPRRGQRAYRFGGLFINDSLAEHRTIRRRLAMLRARFRAAHANRPLTVTARWVRPSAAGEPDPATAGEGLPAVLTAAQLAGMAVIHRGSVSCRNRQRVTIGGGVGETVVTGSEPVVSQNAAVAAPVVRTVRWGPLLEIEPRIDRDETAATVWVRSVVGAPRPAGEGGGRIERRRFAVATLETETRIPLGKPVLVGGLVGPGHNRETETFLVLRIDAAEPPAQSRTRE